MRSFIAAAAATAVTAGLGAPALAAVTSDDDPTPSTRIEAQASADASAGTGGDAQPACHVAEWTVGDDAIGGSTRLEVCVSSDGASASASGSAHASGEGADGEWPEPEAIDVRERIRQLIEALRGGVPSTQEPGEDPGQEPADDGEDDLYHDVVEDTLGLDVYEDEVCDDRHTGDASAALVDEYAHGYVVDCWLDDYLVGDYLRNHLLDDIDDRAPVDLGPVTGAARDLIDAVLGVTNADGGAAPAPQMPDVPTPDTPQFGAPDLGTPGLPIDAVGRVEQFRGRLVPSP